MSDKHEPYKSEWQDAQERWEARLRLWDIEDQGGYITAMEREMDGEPPLHLVW
jgi:hypothetical protein